MNDIDRERLLAELVRRDEGRPGESPVPMDDGTVAALQADLETLIDGLRQPPPFDTYEDESGCRRAVELAEQIHPVSGGNSTSAASVPAGPRFERIGPYQIVAELGRGGMGSVFRAKHDRLKRVVAVKVLSTGRMNDPKARARFEREMEAIGALNHPNIVAAHDAGEAEGMHYLVMECVEGLDLATVVRRHGALPIADACEIIRQAAQGLKAANDRGIIHRDVKPSNLMLAEGIPEHPEATVKVLDFGLARLAPLQTDPRNLTLSGQIVGTLKYMAPEQCTNSGDIDVRTDMYSLGATFYKLLCGSSPFSHEQFTSPLALLTALGSQDPAPLSSYRPDLPAKLVAIVQRMMAKSPEQRYASFQEVIELLNPWARGAKLAELLERVSDMADPADAASSRQRENENSVTPVRRSAVTRKISWGAMRGVLFGCLIGFLLALMIVSTQPVSRWITKARPTTQGAAGSRDPFQHARNAARWVQLRGGTVEVAFDDTGSRALGPNDALPKQNFHLNSASLAGDATVIGKDLAEFNDLPFFFSLMLNQTLVDDAALRELGRLPLLRCLYLSNTQVTDAALRDLKRYPQLTHLHLQGTAITDSGLAHLKAFPHLNQIYLVGCRVGDEGLAHLVGLKKLGTLWLEGTDVTVAGVAKLKLALPACLISSSFSERQIAAAVVAEQRASSPSVDSSDDAAGDHDRKIAEWLLPRASQLAVATAEGVVVTVRPGEPLPPDFVHLTSVNLDGHQGLSNADLARFDELPLFMSLSVGRTRVNDDGMRHLGRLPRLQMLFLSETDVSDAGLQQLQRYPKLEVLHLFATQVTDAGLAHLNGHRMLYDLSLVGCGITDDGLKHLTGLTRLQILALNRTGVTARGVVSIQQSLSNCEVRSDYSTEELAVARESLERESIPPEDR